MNKKKKDILRDADVGIETGEYYLKRTRLSQAHKAFEIALYYNRSNINALLHHSKLYDKYFWYDKSLNDCETALDRESHDPNILQRRSRVQFLKSDFEIALVNNYRGCPIRKQPPKFQLGIYDCKEAVEATIGAKAGPVLKNYYHEIKKLENKKAQDRQRAYENRWKRHIDPKEEKRRQQLSDTILNVKSKKKVKSLGPVPSDSEQPVSGTIEEKIPKYMRIDVQNISEELEQSDTDECQCEPIQARTTNIKNFIAEKYLEKMRFHKELLYKCSNPSVGIPNNKGNERIAEAAIRGFNVTLACQEHLRSRNPFYAVRWREINVLRSLYKKEMRELLKVQELNTAEAGHIIEILRSAREHYKTRMCQEIISRAQEFFDSKNKRQLPRKDQFKEIACRIIGLAYLDTLRAEPDNPEITEKRIKFLLELPFSKEPSNDSLIREMKPLLMIDNKKMINKTKSRIKMVQNALELSWLYYDLARYLINMKKYELAGFYAKECMKYADKNGNEVWALNGAYYKIKCYVNTRNRNDAKDACLDAIDRAKIIYYPHQKALLQFLNETLRVIDELDYEQLERVDAIHEREQAILSVMAANATKSEVDNLFRKLSTVPANRRLSVCPGVQLPMPVRISEKAKGSSISNPLIRKTMERIQPTKKKGGDAFMNLL